MTGIERLPSKEAVTDDVASAEPAIEASGGIGAAPAGDGVAEHSQALGGTACGKMRACLIS
ncbi:MAG TPA: hypothetical protein VMZ92_04815 [Planctomycetota bacterium]|nr:hypothetical protein [Planctomycetota bacterium]